MLQEFSTLDLDPALQQGISELGFKTMTPIQAEAIPQLLLGHDLVATAQTGTGKTAAFLIPMIEHLIKMPEGTTRGLVLTPTRELAQQIDQQMLGLAYHAGITSAVIMGGVSMSEQESAIREKSDVLIATPGRLMDHMRYDYLNLKTIDFVVLDEADRMLDIGFLPAVQRIFYELPEERQTLLFSATMPAALEDLAKRFMRQPKRIQIGQQAPAAQIHQRFFAVSKTGKESLLMRLLRNEMMDSVLVFARSKIDVRRLNRRLYNAGFDCDSIHGDRSQEDRNKALERFRRGEVNILVATDVASRGLDINDVSHVVNFNTPSDPDDYIHRVGRTARAKKSGEAITFVDPDDMKHLQRIERVLKMEINLEQAQESTSRGRRRSRRGGARANY